MKWYQRLLTPLIFWGNLLKTKAGRLKRRPAKEIVVPEELLPLLQVGTIAMRYSEFKDVPPETLKLSVKLQEVVDGQTDTDTILFVEKVLFGRDLFDTIFTWLVFLEDAVESDRETFRAYLTHQKKTAKNNA
jgi:hypothetical protein